MTSSMLFFMFPMDFIKLASAILRKLRDFSEVTILSQNEIYEFPATCCTTFIKFYFGFFK